MSDEIETIDRNPKSWAAWKREAERLQKIIDDMAAMDSEPVAYMWDSKRNDIDAPGFYFPEHLFFAESNVKQWGGEVIPLYRHAQPAPQLNPVGYLFVSDQGAIAYSPTDWGMPGFKLAGQIFGDIDVKAQPAPVVPDKGHKWSYGLIHPENCQCIECRSARLNGVKS